MFIAMTLSGHLYLFFNHANVYSHDTEWSSIYVLGVSFLRFSTIFYWILELFWQRGIFVPHFIQIFIVMSGFSLTMFNF
jgi:hypothetical protein